MGWAASADRDRDGDGDDAGGAMEMRGARPGWDAEARSARQQWRFKALAGIRNHVVSVNTIGKTCYRESSENEAKKPRMNIVGESVMNRPRSSAENPLSPNGKWLVAFCRTRSILRNATSSVMRSIRQSWSPTCSCASTLRRPAPKLSYGTRLPGVVNKGLTATRALYRHVFQNDCRRKSKRISICSALTQGPNSKAILPTT